LPALAFLSKIGVSSHSTATGWWLALLIALVVSALTATTGFVDWLGIEWGTELWKTATLHMFVMVSATGVFLGAVLWGHAGYTNAAVETGPFILTLVGFGLLAIGGWLGGSIVFVHGMRVLSLVEEPTERAVAPIATPEKEKAEGA
jgi:uncharacterized membrane protein